MASHALNILKFLGKAVFKVQESVTKGKGEEVGENDTFISCSMKLSVSGSR